MSLLRLQIENLALIEHADIEFDGGLNVFTGETGAGKTMLAQAIGLLAGASPAPGMVGPHGAEAYVEAEFDVPEAFYDEAPEAVRALRPEGETTLVVARRLGASGRSRALLWGRSCARDDLEQLGEMLIEISSQHEARRLARPATQLDLLDAAAGNGDLRHAMSEAWTALRAARARLEAATAEAAAAERQRGELEELVARVGEASIQPGERPSLEAERERLRHVDELVSAVAGAAAALNPDEGDGALGMAAHAAELVQGVERFESALAPVAEELRDAAVRLQEASVELRAQLDGFEGDPGRLEEVEARLQLFTDLERRFGEPAEQLAARAVEAQASLELLDGGGERRAALERDVEDALAEAAGHAAALRTAREGAAGPFAAAAGAELTRLGMDGARLEVRLEEGELGARGGDRVTLLLAANAGLPAGPIATVASGGELSRIALAVRVVARSGGGAGTLLLDEVDAGVGGRTANAVADTLRRLAADAQLLCITHLPQIAGAADAHFRVEKTGGDPATTAVTRLEGEVIVDEVARMLGAEEDDETARRHAAALLG